MLDDSPKLDLMEPGTRWQHYSELKELFIYDIERIEHMKFTSTANDEKLIKLKHAVELLDARINLLADFVYNTSYGSKLRRVIEEEVDALYQDMKRERANEEAKATEAKPKDDDSESPADYTTK